METVSSKLKDKRPTALKKVFDFSAGSKSFEQLSSPRILPGKMPVNPNSKRMDPERKAHIIGLLRKNMPTLIRARRDEIDARAKYAALCVLDAFQGRLSNGLANNSKKDYLTFKIFSIQTSDWFLNLIVASSVLHTSMIFFEPLNEECSPYMTWIFGIHWLVFIIQLIDVLMKMYYEGVREYMGHDWQQLYATTVFLHFFDLLWFKRTTLTNPLRPIIGLLRARSVRRFFTVVKSMIPSLTQTLAPLVAFLMIITVLCNLVFHDTFADSSVDSLSYNWLWLVLTNDTFARLFPENVESHAIYVIFFFATLYVGQRFILSVVLGHTFETFTAFTSKQVKKEKLKQMQGLVKAFTALDYDKTGYISEQVWSALLKNLHPNMSKEEIALYYELIAAGDNNGIFIFQFLSLEDVLSFKFEKTGGVSIKESTRLLYDFFSHYNEVKCPISDALKTRGSAVFEWVTKRRLFGYVNWYDIILLNLGVHDHPLLTLPYVNSIYLTSCHVVSAFLFFELVLKLIQNDGKFVKLGLDVFENRYTQLFLVGAIGVIVVDYIQAVGMIIFPAWYSLVANQRFLHVVRVVLRCLRCCRMFYINEDLSAFITAVIAVGPIFFQNMLFAVIVAYIFAMVGNILFGAYCEVWSTPMLAMVTVQKLFLPIDLLDLMEDVTQKVHPVAILYFLVYFLMSLIICNLSLSLVIELYSDILKLKGYDPKQDMEKYERLYKTIMERALVRRVLAGAHSDFHHFRMVKDMSGNDHRLKFVDGDLGITTKDLKACKKYAAIDLVKLYDSHNRKLKDVTWEADFVKELKELGMGKVKQYKDGEKITTKGEKALNGYILIAGTVSILDETESDIFTVIMKPTNVLGIKFLCPSSTYGHTCIANSDSVECIEIPQDVFEEQSDHAVIGQLVRMCFKTDELYKAGYEENLSRRLNPKRVASFHVQPVKGAIRFSDVDHSLGI